MTAGLNTYYTGESPAQLRVALSEDIGAIFRGQSAAEKAAGVTPVNPVYPPGNVLRYGNNTTPGVTDMTSAVNAAIAQGVLSNGAEVFFPIVSTNPTSSGTFQNDYIVSSVIPIVGALKMRGEIDQVTFKGPRVNSTVNGDTFTVSGGASISLVFEDLGFTNSQGGATAGAAFLHMTTSGGANSIYFKNCWFYLPCFYALNFNGAIDDVQILGCTFDVSAQHWIAVGGASAQVTNFSMVGNTVFGFECQGMIDLINVRNATFTGNRFYNAAGQPVIPYCINCLTDSPVAIENLVVSGNTFDIANDAVLLSSKVSQASITGNTFNAFLAGPAIAGGGGVAIDQITITGNVFKGASGTGGVIDFTGTPLTNSVIANNSIVGNAGGTSAVGVNIPSASNANNTIGPNSISGCTAQYGVAAWAGHLATVGPQTFVGTLTGVTGSPTATFRYSIDGNTVTLTLVGNLTGTAAGTAPSITGLPAAITPANMQTFPIAIQNNSAFGPGFLQISGTTLSLFSSSFGAFANAGSQGAVSFNITYQLS